MPGHDAWLARRSCGNAVARPMAMSLALVPGLYPHRSTAPEENDMTASYTFDVFSSLDGYGAASGNWTGYWGKQGRSCSTAAWPCTRRGAADGLRGQHLSGLRPDAGLEHRGVEVRDPWVTRMRSLPATVVSTTLEEPLDWPDATVVSGDAVDVVARLKEESDVPLRSHGSLSMNRALMAPAWSTASRSRSSLSSPVRPGWIRSFRAPTSTWS